MKKVVVYSTKECPWCKKTKEFLKAHNISFTEKDVGSDEKAAEEMVKKSGQQGVPVIEIDGKISVGFDEEKLKKELGIS
jgi:glutaredoxin-like YruB-family protein